MVAVLLLAATVLPRAASADDRYDCEKLTGEASLRACTALIEAGKNSAPVMAIAYHNRGLENFRKGYHQQAINDFSASIALNPSADAYNNRGNVYHLKRDYERAISDFDSAIALNPKHILAYNNRGIAYDDRNEFDRALADFDRAIALNPAYLTAYNNRGNTYFRMANYGRAIEDFDQVLALSPNDAVAYRNRARAYQSLGRYELAADDYRAALQLKPSESAAAGLQVVEALLAARAKEEPVAETIDAAEIGFRHMQNTDLVGPLISKARAQDLAECEAACAGDEACKAYSFNAWNSLCFLKQEPTLRLLEPSTVSGLKGETYPPPISDATPAMVRFRAKLFPGTPAREAPEARFEDCEQSCEASENCVAYSFIKADSVCRMFERADEYSSDDGADSGAKRQVAN